MFLSASGSILVPLNMTGELRRNQTKISRVCEWIQPSTNYIVWYRNIFENYGPNDGIRFIVYESSAFGVCSSAFLPLPHRNDTKNCNFRSWMLSSSSSLTGTRYSCTLCCHIDFPNSKFAWMCGCASDYPVCTKTINNVLETTWRTWMDKMSNGFSVHTLITKHLLGLNLNTH